jgi:hypothetical protein
MPKLTKVSLHDVQFLSPPPYRHPHHIDLTIRYTSIISFRGKDMNDIAIVFPNLRTFSLHIRGPYLSKHIRQASTENNSDGPNGANQMPFSFPDLESLDISAKDLDHSLARFQGSFLPRLKKLTLRDNGIPAATNFFSHLVRSHVPLSILGLSDYSDKATRVFRMYPGIKALEVPLSAASLEVLRPATTKPPPIGSPLGAPMTVHGKGNTSPILSFPSTETLILAPPIEDTGGSVGKLEGATLKELANIVRERNVAVFGMYSVEMTVDSTGVKLGDGRLDAADGGGETKQNEPMESEDTLVDIPVHTTPKASPLLLSDAAGGTSKRGRTLGALEAVPILDVQYLTAGEAMSGPISKRGRVAMEDVNKALVDGRKSWKYLGFDMTA